MIIIQYATTIMIVNLNRSTNDKVKKNFQRSSIQYQIQVYVKSKLEWLYNQSSLVRIKRCQQETSVAPFSLVCHIVVFIFACTCTFHVCSCCRLNEMPLVCISSNICIESTFSPYETKYAAKITLCMLNMQRQHYIRYIYTLLIYILTFSA